MEYGNFDLNYMYKFISSLKRRDNEKRNFATLNKCNGSKNNGKRNFAMGLNTLLSRKECCF